METDQAAEVIGYSHETQWMASFSLISTIINVIYISYVAIDWKYVIWLLI